MSSNLSMSNISSALNSARSCSSAITGGHVNTTHQNNPSNKVGKFLYDGKKFRIRPKTADDSDDEEEVTLSAYLSLIYHLIFDICLSVGLSG
jgi:hypothetical protein